MMTIQNEGLYQTLLAQLQKLARHNRHGSFKTRERYYNACKRFCAFLADHFRLEKLSNLSEKHLVAYVEELHRRGCAPAYIKTELSAIRLYHDLIPNPRYMLPGNDSLNLERRRYGQVDRTWSADEVDRILELCRATDNHSYAACILLARYAGLRIHETMRMDTATARAAVKTGTLTIKGKGGKVREVPIPPIIQRELQHFLAITPTGHKLFVSDVMDTHQAHKNLQQFIHRHREAVQDSDSSRPMTYHGLRHTWAVERYEELIQKGLADSDARKKVSQWLGHERESVTKIYLASLDPKEGGERV